MSSPQQEQSNGTGMFTWQMAARLLVAAIVAFVVSTAWYIAFSAAMRQLRGFDGGTESDMSVPAWLMFAEIGRNLVVAAIVAYLVVRVNAVNLRSTMALGVALWLGFPAMILIGSVLWEDVPWKLAAIHSGDWLVKLLAISVVIDFRRIGRFRRQVAPSTTR